jgi:transposase-like protein
MESPKTLQQAIQHFGDFENCRQFMIAVRWPDGKVRCPYCDSEKVTYLANARLYRCYGDHPKQKFSLKVGTVFEDSPIALEKWLPAVWLVVNCKNGISSYELHRALGVTQKSAWFMLHRIRLAMQSKSFVKMGGPGSGGPGSECEVDETFIGGKARNMHKSVRDRRITGRGKSAKDKAIVMGILQRGGQVRAQVIANRTKETLHPLVREHVQAGAALYSDELHGYWGLEDEYQHKVIDHAVKYVDGRIHTNGLENFWSLLKRGISGTYVSVEPFHLFRYLDEQAYRYNNRATKDNPLNDADRFHLAMTQITGKRLTFAEVTGKVGETAF